MGEESSRGITEDEILMRRAHLINSPGRRSNDGPEQRERTDAIASTIASDAAIAAALAEMEGSLEYDRNQLRTRSDDRPANVDRAADEDSAATECITCLSGPANACLIPCGHIVVCVRCSTRLNPKLCP